MNLEEPWRASCSASRSRQLIKRAGHNKQATNKQLLGRTIPSLILDTSQELCEETQEFGAFRGGGEGFRTAQQLFSHAIGAGGLEMRRWWGG